MGLLAPLTMVKLSKAQSVVSGLTLIDFKVINPDLQILPNDL